MATWTITTGWSNLQWGNQFLNQGGGEANGIEFSSIEKNIEIELLWNSLIFKIYNDKLIIDIDEINDQLKLIQKQEKIKEYLISEIIIERVPNGEINSKI